VELKLCLDSRCTLLVIIIHVLLLDAIVRHGNGHALDVVQIAEDGKHRLVLHLGCDGLRQCNS
jgi:hypothetical protein